MNKTIKIIIIATIIVGITIGAYFITKTKNTQRNFPERPQNFQVNQKTEEEIISFFNSASDSQEIETYCKDNGMNCMYYCKNINPEDEYCTQMIENMPQRNFSRENFMPPEDFKSPEYG